MMISLRLSECRSYHNQVTYYSNWLKWKPDEQNLARTELTTAELAFESETAKFARRVQDISRISVTRFMKSLSV